MIDKQNATGIFITRALIAGGTVSIVSAIFLLWLVHLGNPPCFFHPIDNFILFATLPGNALEIFIGAFELFRLSSLDSHLFFAVGISSIYYGVITTFMFLIPGRRIARFLVILGVILLALGLNAVGWFLLTMMGVQACA